MEKRTPHCKLTAIKGLIEAGQVRSTFAALSDAGKVGLDFPAMGDVVKALTTQDFYKSMTTHADHRVWQDVYRPQTPAGHFYVKLTVVNDVLIVSFKEL